MKGTKFMKWQYEIPLLSGREVLAALKRMAFKETHRKASPVKMKYPDGSQIVFPYYDEIDRFTLQSTLKDAEIDIKGFLKNI